MKVDVIKKYFQSWLDNDVEVVKQTFSENALYSVLPSTEIHIILIFSYPYQNLLL